jgi:hypothetical protein
MMFFVKNEKIMGMAIIEQVSRDIKKEEENEREENVQIVKSILNPFGRLPSTIM